ncbi:MAG: ABC transporter permease [Bacteroidales bacterium]|nr:ABC transporter permease [Bacteroidales bacterium]
MSVVSFVSKRLSLKEERDKRLSPAIIVAISGVALSFLVMMLSIAVVRGFKNEITRKIIGFDSQLSVFPLNTLYGDDVSGMEYDDTLREIIGGVAAEILTDSEIKTGMSVSVTGMLKTETDFAGVSLRGLEGEGMMDFVKSVMVEGDVAPADSQRGIVVSRKTADKLLLSVGDKIDAYFIDDNGTIRPRKFEISGIYSTGFGDYDNLIAFAPFSVVAKLLKFGDGECEKIDISGLRTEVIEDFAYNLQSALNKAYSEGRIPEALAVNTVLNTGAAYFNWLALLDTNVVVILILMGCVSGLMLITCVIILILQRVRTVGVLKSLGASDAQIRGIFMRLGARVIGAGLIIGNAVSLLVIAAEWKWHLLPLDPDSYYLTYVPVEFSFGAWILLNVSVAALSYMVMLVPSGMISRLSPVKSLRFE